MQGFGLQNDTCSALLCSVIHVRNPEPICRSGNMLVLAFLLQSTCWLDVLRQNSAFYLLIFATDSTVIALLTGDCS